MGLLDLFSKKPADPRIRFLGDRFIFDYGTLSRPYRMPDASGWREVLYSNIPNLGLEPVLDPKWDSSKSRIPIYVPKVRRTVVFIHDQWQEDSMGPLFEDLYGPYLARESKLRRLVSQLIRII